MRAPRMLPLLVVFLSLSAGWAALPAVLGPTAAVAQSPPPASPPSAPAANDTSVCDPVPSPDRTCIWALHHTQAMAGISHNLYAIAWRPKPNPFNGLYEALIVGGIPGGLNPGLPQRGIVLLYDGKQVSRVFDHEGPQMVDVAWAPDGSYAIVVSDRKPIYRVEPPAPGKPQYTFTNLWDCAHVAVENCDQAPYYGFQVAFHPDGAFAWITGSALLSYDGVTLKVVDEGNDIAWRAIAWEPGGARALLSALVCINPEDPAHDVPCAGNITQGRFVGGRVVVADTRTTKLCEVFTYGKYDIRRAEVNGITWAANGTEAFLYGDDDFHGTILRFDARAASPGLSPRGCPILDHAFAYLSEEKPEGEFNEMVWDARSRFYWTVGGGGQEMWVGNGANFTYWLGEHDITRGKGTIYYGIAWHPTLDWFLVAGFQGKLYKVAPAQHPVAILTDPRAPPEGDPPARVAGETDIGGAGYAPTPLEPVERVEVNITDPDGTSTGWVPAQLVATGAEAAGTQRSRTTFSYAWDTRPLDPGLYTLQARALLRGNWSKVASRVVEVVPGGDLPPPTFDALPAQDGDGNYTLHWSSPSQGARFELEEAVLPARFQLTTSDQGGQAVDYAFLGQHELLYQGSDTMYAVQGREDGSYFYRVRTVADSAVSPWSRALEVTVAIDADADGISDAEELARGSDPHNATSSPDDLDGDHHVNSQDAFPLDPSEWQDTDGDGVGDNTDAFPLDPRDAQDSDRDTFGDRAESRLGSNPFDAASTPDTDDDSDGCLNQQEATAHTDPRDATSAPAFCARAQANGPSGGKGAPGFDALLGLVAVAGAAGMWRRRR